MKLQKMKHSRNDTFLDLEDDFSIITHIVDQNSRRGIHSLRKGDS